MGRYKTLAAAIPDSASEKVALTPIVEFGETKVVVLLAETRGGEVSLMTTVLRNTDTELPP